MPWSWPAGTQNDPGSLTSSLTKGKLFWQKELSHSPNVPWGPWEGVWHVWSHLASGEQFRLEAELWDPKPTAPPTIPRRMARVEMAAFQRLVPSLVGQDTPSPAEVKWSESHSVVSHSLWPHGLYSPWNSPGQNTGVGSLSLLQGIFPTQGLSPGLLHCRQILYQLEPQGKPKNTGVGSPSLLPWTFLAQESNWVSCIAEGFFTIWIIRETL